MDLAEDDSVTSQVQIEHSVYEGHLCKVIVSKSRALCYFSVEEDSRTLDLRRWTQEEQWVLETECEGVC